MPGGPAAAAFVYLATGDASLVEGAPLLAEPSARGLLAEAIAAAAEVDVLDKRVVLQDCIWVDTHAVVHPLEEMSADYRAAVLGFLGDRETMWLSEALVFLAVDVSRGVHQQDVVFELIRELGRLGPGWMRETPLGRRLLELRATENEVGGETS
jgi:hypothetical protein